MYVKPIYTNRMCVNTQKDVWRGEIWLVKLKETKGSIQNRTRPCLVISNNRANLHSPAIHISPLTTSTTKAKLPTHINLRAEDTGLMEDSLLLCEQTMLITKDQLIAQVGYCKKHIMEKINDAVAIQFGLKYA